MVGKINKNLLDKVLTDLNLTEQQMLEEGMWDRVKAAGTAFANPTSVQTPTQVPVDLKANTLQTIEKLKALANSLESQANTKPTISAKEASALYAQLNAFIVSSIRSAQATLTAPPSPAVPAATQPTGATTVVGPGPTAQVSLGAQPTASLPTGPGLGIQQPTTTPVPPVLQTPTPSLQPGANTFNLGYQQPINKPIQ